MDNFVKGMDISSIIEVENNGGKFYYDGVEEDIFSIFEKCGVNSIRIRLWVNPYTIDKKPYLGGTNDLEKALLIAKRAKAKNMSILLDFHYSDFRVDPSKQTLPKAWINELCLGKKIYDLVYDYTKETLSIFKKEGINVEYVQIGNEITNGMCWPLAKLDYHLNEVLDEGKNNLIKILNSGIKASKEVFPKIKTIVHLERSGFKDVIDNFLKIIYKDVDFDILGFSYYPYWHSDFKDLENCIRYIKDKYHKDMMIVETSYAYDIHDMFIGHEKLPLVINKELDKITTPVEIPLTRDGQVQFLEKLFSLARFLNLLGIYYWEPAMINVPGISRASKEAMDYINEKKSFGNEWANQALFDETFNALDSLKMIKKL